MSKPGTLSAQAPEEFDEALRALLEAIFLRYQHDFRHYAISSLRRRISAAMAEFGCASVAELHRRVMEEPTVFSRMLGFLTVQVSEMFRDPRYFAAVRSDVVPVLRTYPSVKLWVAGCSTGEEVWSLAIVLAEEGMLERALIYATDINAEAMRKAEAGIFPLDRIAAFSASYLAAGGRKSLSDYYHATKDGAAFDRSLIGKVLFADHSLATDNVFSEAHFVSCRNVLIYFDRALQDRAIGLFCDALVRRGHLGLGSKESLRLSSYAERFDEVPEAQRIYVKR